MADAPIATPSVARRRPRRVRPSAAGVAAGLCGLLIAPAHSTARDAPGRAQDPAASGTIVGRVVVERPLPPIPRRPSVDDLGMPRPSDVPDRYRSVVYLETAPQGAFEQPPPGQAVMRQHNETFEPHVLAVTVGTVVAFPNLDHVYHNVFSLSKAARFDLGRYAAGRSKSVRMEHPGIVRVFCDIHSHMSAFILVFSHPFFAVTGPSGVYRLAGVPPGTYHVIAWNEGVASEPQPVTVRPGDQVTLDFVLR